MKLMVHLTTLTMCLGVLLHPCSASNNSRSTGNHSSARDFTRTWFTVGHFPGSTRDQVVLLSRLGSGYVGVVDVHRS